MPVPRLQSESLKIAAIVLVRTRMSLKYICAHLRYGSPRSSELVSLAHPADAVGAILTDVDDVPILVFSSCSDIAQFKVLTLSS